MDSEPGLRFVTASLHVDYLKPTPIDATLTVRAAVKSVEGRRITISSQVHAGDQMTARGEAVCVRVPDHWGESDAG